MVPILQKQRGLDPESPPACFLSPANNQASYSHLKSYQLSVLQNPVEQI